MLVSANTSSAATDGKKAEECFSAFASAGIGAIDYNFDAFVSWREVHAEKPIPIFDLPLNDFFAHFDAVYECAKRHGLVFGQTHAPFPTQIVGASDTYNAYLREAVIRSIRVTARFSCPYIIIHPFFGDYQSEMSIKEEHRVNIEFYSSLIPVLRECGVVACLENMWVSHNAKIYGASCSDYHEANEYIEELNAIAGEELFGFCYDSGHAVLVGGNHTRNLAALRPHLKAVHLHDVDGVHDSHTLPFYGLTDWDKLMSALAACDYKGTLDFEAFNGWVNLPEPVRKHGINLLGAIGRYFVNQYFG